MNRASFTAGTVELTRLFDRRHEAEIFVRTGGGCRGVLEQDEWTTVLLDEVPAHQAACVFIRCRTPDATLRLELAGCRDVRATPAGGWVLESPTEPDVRYWLPRAPLTHRLDAQARVLADDRAELLALDIEATGVRLAVRAQPSHVIDCTVWRLPLALTREFDHLSALETQGYFLWGSHTVYRGPASIYRHLVHGHVYEDRYEWPRQRRTCSENDAHALYVTVSSLAQRTGKRLYDVLATQLLLSTLHRQGPDGGYRHGEWTDELESHFRLHASAMHLMMDALTWRPDAAVAAALGRAADYAVRQRDEIEDGAWFLHDELEKSAVGMNAGPFHWLPSQWHGKAPTNMLVLNTHLDTLVALLRYREITGDDRYDTLTASARQAALAVLRCRPMEWLYALLFRWIGLTLLPTPRASRLPLPVRMLKRLATRYAIPLLPRVKTRYPRLVMPGGYVDRALSLRNWSHRYLTINAMDLARASRRLPSDGEFLDVMRGALLFAERSGIAERWQEKEADRYAIGFLAEALYHACTLEGSWHWRAALAAQLMVLAKLDRGFPPSTLGANREIVPDSSGHGDPLIDDARLRTVWIPHGAHEELMLLNVGDEPVSLALDAAGFDTFRWRDPRQQTVAAKGVLDAGQWWIGTR